MQNLLKARGWRYSLLLVLLMTALLGASHFQPPRAVQAAVAPDASPQLPPELQEPVTHGYESSRLPVESYELPILAYHSICKNKSDAKCVEADEFRKQLNYLKQEGFRTISFEDLLKWEMGVTVLPKKPIILTFDDGYLDNYTLMAPILREQRMRATVFLTSRWMGTQNFLTWDLVRKMQNDGIEFGGHTLTHPNLTKVPAVRQHEEIEGCKMEIEAQIKRPVLAFSYPYGFQDEVVVDITKKAGYIYAVSGQSGWAAPVESPYALKRVVISGYTTLDKFKDKLRGTKQQLP